MFNLHYGVLWALTSLRDIPIDVFINHFYRAGFTVEAVLSIYLELLLSIWSIYEFVDFCWTEPCLRPSIFAVASLRYLLKSLPN